MDYSWLSDCYLNACIGELEAFKPGNVSIHSEGHDMTVEQFKISAQQSCKPLTDIHLELGERIFRAISRTNEAVGCNTNLGIVLLAAPIMLAAQKVNNGIDLKSSINTVLNNTTQQDAEWVYQAILIAKPGGLGKQDEQDVHRKPSVTLTQAMALASDRDRVAFQYQSNYGDIFTGTLPLFEKLTQQWGANNSWVTVAIYLDLLKNHRDSHIERKYGGEIADSVMNEASILSGKFSKSDNPVEFLQEIKDFDKRLKDAGINPGTTADLTVITLLIAGLIEYFG